MSASLNGKTLFISGASRGIGLAIALRAAADGANIIVAAKSVEPHPKLPGTIYTAAEAIVAAGGRALPIPCDIRDEAQVTAAASQGAEHFGGIDILICNASAILLAGTEDTPMKRFDLMHQVNVRGTFLCGKACIPYLRKSKNPHILAISPPLQFSEKWWGAHVAYTIAKYGMSLCIRGWAEELRGDGIAANALWPRTAIATAALQMLADRAPLDATRKPEIVADAAHWILTRPSRDYTGNFAIDDDVLSAAGERDFDKYRAGGADHLIGDLFIDEDHAAYRVRAMKF